MAQLAITPVDKPFSAAYSSIVLTSLPFASTPIAPFLVFVPVEIAVPPAAESVM